MSETGSSWSFVGLTPEARKAAEEAAEAAGMDLDTWLGQLIKYRSAIELRGGERPAKGVVSEPEGAAKAQAPSAPVGAAPPPSPSSETDRPAPERPAPPAAVPDPAPDAGTDTPSVRSAEEMTPPSLSAATNPPTPSKEPPPPIGGATSDGALRMIATDMLRPSLLAAINVVGKDEIDLAYDRWRRTGRLEPLTVRAAPDAPGSFEIITGIDRWHAARRAQAPEVPVIESALNDEEAIREGLAARLKRGHLSALDEADIYLRLMTDAAQTAEQVARMAGKPPAHIATMVRILNLPKAVREMVARGELTVLHARALLDTQDPEPIAREVAARRLDIYQTEQLVRMAAHDLSLVRGTATDEPAAAPPDPAQETSDPTPAAAAQGAAPDSSTVTETPTEVLERHLSHLLGMKVTIDERDLEWSDAGVVSLHYRSREQLSNLIARLNSSSET